MDEIKDALPGGWLTILVVIVLGAFGSATWEIFFKPFYIKGRNFLLSFLTLWKDNQKNKIYYQVSYGSSKQHLSIYISELLTMIFVSLLICSFIFIKFSTLDAVNKEYNKILELESSVLDKVTKKEKSKKFNVNDIKELKADIEKIMNELLWFVVISGLFWVYLIGSQSTKLIKMIYIHSVTCHLDTIIKIVRPHLSKTKYDDYQSRYAQIMTKQDYMTLISELYELAEENKMQYLKFQAW